MSLQSAKVPPCPSRRRQTIKGRAGDKPRKSAQATNLKRARTQQNQAELPHVLSVEQAALRSLMTSARIILDFALKPRRP